jgi:transketolase
MARIDDLSYKTIMMLSADGVQKANSGHPGMPMGDAAMAYVLWKKFLRHNPKNPQWANRDRFVLSAGHGSMLLYSLLHLTGHDISLDDIKDFRQFQSKTPGHPEYCLPCGIEMTTGPLGQGFATGVGMAMAEKYLARTFNKPGFRLFDHHIYGIVSDGDLMEGVSSEAASLAGHLGLGKIVYLYSDNKITIDGGTDLSFTENVQNRFKAYGWHAEKVDAYDLKAIEKAIRTAKNEKSKPSLLLMQTHIGYGSPHKQDTSDAHGAPLGEEEIKLVKKSFGFPPSKKFYIPATVKKNMMTAVAAGRKMDSDWSAMLRRYRKKHKKLAALLEAAMNGLLPEGWDAELPRFKAGEKVATRSASGKFLNAVADGLPHLIGGSADLAPSNNTFIKGAPEFNKKRAARNIHFGVREHAMGAIMNGMSLSDILIPYGGTFLIFTDYLRPASRLSALMGKHVIYVMTHDSIGLGEDGPTHQPIEQIASYRVMPNMTLIRPADANETVEAWKAALKKTDGPTMLVLTRQGLPVIDRRKCASAANLRKGGYVLYETKGRKPRIILIASGSEVSLCLNAAPELEKARIPVRIVNMASTELFEAQTAKYRDSVLPGDVRARLAVEAGASLGLQKYVGLDGDVIGLDRFGASAPAGVLFRKFGFTADNVVKRAKGLLGRK